MPNREDDWPPVEDFSPEAWEVAMKRLHEACVGLITELEKAAKKPGCDAILHQIAPGKTHSVYVMLHGAVSRRQIAASEGQRRETRQTTARKRR